MLCVFVYVYASKTQKVLNRLSWNFQALLSIVQGWFIRRFGADPSKGLRPSGSGVSHFNLMGTHISRELKNLNRCFNLWRGHRPSLSAERSEAVNLKPRPQAEVNNEQGIAINRTHFINGPLMEAHFGDAAGQAYLYISIKGLRKQVHSSTVHSSRWHTLSMALSWRPILAMPQAKPICWA